MKISLSENVLFNEIENEYILLHLDTGEYFGLNEIGVDFWKCAQDKSNFDDIIASLLTTYDVDENILKSDINKLIRQLSEAKLISVAMEQSSKS